MPQDKNNPPPATKDFHSVVRDAFSKIKAHAGHIDNAKIDAWQKQWLAMPQTRTKYEHLKDAPAVVLEESLAITNDILDFIQGQEGGKSEFVKKLKALSGEPLHHSLEMLKNKWNEIKARVPKPKATSLPEEGQKNSPPGACPERSRGEGGARGGQKETMKKTAKKSTKKKPAKKKAGKKK